MARITSRDVAREAGVSQTTVSFVLNNRPDQTIPEQTRTAVLDAASRLGYVPSAAARSLRRGRSNVVLCVLPDAPISEAFENFERNLSAALGSSGHTCVFLHYDRATTALASLWQHVHPSVVVSFGTLEDDDAEPITRAGITLIDGVFDPSRSSITGLDQSDIGRLQVQHLAENGHSQIGYGAIDDPREYPFCAPRLRGAEEECKRRGLAPLYVQHLDYTIHSAGSALERWTDGAKSVTAVAAFNDLTALSILAACRTSNIAVPRSISLIGVDDLPAAALVEPALTTIAMDLTVPADTLAQNILRIAEPSYIPSVPVKHTPIFAVRQRNTVRTVR